MVYVIAAPCAGVKDKSCVAVCPVDCIEPGTVTLDGTIYTQLFIDPDVCIGCGMCEPECPVDAIFMDDELPEQWSEYREINRAFYKTRGKMGDYAAVCTAPSL